MRGGGGTTRNGHGTSCCGSGCLHSSLAAASAGGGLGQPLLLHDRCLLRLELLSGEDVLIELDDVESGPD